MCIVCGEKKDIPQITNDKLVHGLKSLPSSISPLYTYDGVRKSVSPQIIPGFKGLSSSYWGTPFIQVEFQDPKMVGLYPITLPKIIGLASGTSNLGSWNGH